MNVCFISSYPPPTTGIATYTSRLCSTLAEHDVRVSVLSNTTGSGRSKVRIVKAWSESRFTYPLSLFRQAVSGRFDIIHIQHEYWLYGRGLRSLTFLFLLFLLKFIMKPVVVTMHCIIPRDCLTEEFFKKHGLGKKALFVKRLYILLYNKLICLLTSKLIVHSNTAKNVLIKDYAFKWDKIVVIHHGTDPKGYKLNYMRNKNVSFRSIIFGEIRRGKGIEHVISAMPEILRSYLPFKLIVAGMYDVTLSPESEGYLGELKALIRRLGLKGYVEFKLNVPEEEVEKLFLEADIVILPYVEDEIIAASGPLLTAMGFGKPIVATNLRRFQGYLKNNENAIIVPPADSISLAKAVTLLLSDNSLRERLSKVSRALAKSFSWEEIAKETLTIYKELIAR